MNIHIYFTISIKIIIYYIYKIKNKLNINSNTKKSLFAFLYFSSFPQFYDYFSLIFVQISNKNIVKIFRLLNFLNLLSLNNTKFIKSQKHKLILYSQKHTIFDKKTNEIRSSCLICSIITCSLIRS